MKFIGQDGLDTQGLPGAGHILLVEAVGEETYDIVRDSVAGLGLGLVRMEQRRHHIAEVFRTEEAPEATGPVQQHAVQQHAVQQSAVQQKGSGRDEL